MFQLILSMEGFKKSLFLLLCFHCIYFGSPQYAETWGNFSINTYIFKIQHNLGGNPPRLSHSVLPANTSSVTSNILFGMALVASVIMSAMTLKKCCTICSDAANPQVSPDVHEVFGNRGGGEITVNTVSSSYGLKPLNAFEELPPPTYEECMKHLMLLKKMEAEKIVIEDC